MEKIIQLKAMHIKTDTLVLKNLLQTEIVDKNKKNQDQQRFSEHESKIKELTSKLAIMKEKQYTATQNLEHKNNELCKHNIYLEKLEVERKELLQEIKQLEEKRDNLKSYKPNLQDQQMLELGRKKLKLYKDLTRIQWDYEATKHSVKGYVSNNYDYIHHFCHENQETSDKLADSLCGKIKDGILPEKIMGTAEDLLTAKNQSDLILKTDTELKESVYDLLRTIKDPEKPQTLEQLDVVYEDCITICHSTPGGVSVIRVEFNPTVPHCSLATLIGLCIRIKLERYLIASFKLDIYIKEGAHSTEQEINKQINDKERIAAAMENPNLRELVEKCILEEDY